MVDTLPMSKSLDQLYKNQSLIYKYILYGVALFCIVFFFPKGGQFKYEFSKGKLWQYENLKAPFDFSIKKEPSEIEREERAIKSSQLAYYQFNTGIAQAVSLAYNEKLRDVFPASSYNPNQLNTLTLTGHVILDKLYKYGILYTDTTKPVKHFFLLKNNEARKVSADEIFLISDVKDLVKTTLQNEGLQSFNAPFQELFLAIVRPNVGYDEELTNRFLNDDLSRISHTRGTISEGDLIIAKGEVVEDDKFKILNSLRQEYQSEVWSVKNQYYILSGYAVLVALVLMMLFLFLKKYRPSIYENNTKVTFIISNIVLMVFITTMVVKYNETYVFVVPLCILPLILKTFFDARLGLFVHVLTVLILGFVVPNSFEYIFLQIIAGIVTILTVSELYKRANLFISIAQITLIYMVGYLAFQVIQEGNLNNIVWMNLGLFLLNGMITLFAQPLIYIYEKVFGLVSDVSLLELSDTNSKLLKELSNKAPGTFHHSLQVSNLAEAAANEIGANAMLVRVGALYHDIGEMLNPTYFTENQITNVNPHDELSAIDSAKIIIDHVIGGIELARKNNLPDRVIDFIRCHHGTTLVYYFYKKQQEIDPEVSDSLFRYPGPIPFSKETAILMMADSVEAASKSLKNPTFLMIDEFVDKIVAGQMTADQFLNANITFKEIQTIKKVFKQKLTNIYHLRVEYPE